VISCLKELKAIEYGKVKKEFIGPWLVVCQWSLSFVSGHLSVVILSVVSGRLTAVSGLYWLGAPQN
jgi:hypothetical protein